MRVAVVGAGIGGLAAAWFLQRAGAEVVVLEGRERVGGALRIAEVDGTTTDVGAEALLARRPEALDLCAELGLEVVHPATSSAAVWTHGALREMPPTVMGIPTDVDAAVESGILRRPPVGRSVPVPSEDVSVGAFVRERVGAEVLERLVAPLLGGVYAGDADRLSLRAAGAPIEKLGADPLAAAADSPPRGAGETPVFAGLPGGVGRLPEILATRLSEVRTGAVVRGLRPDGVRWRVDGRAGPSTVDGVVVAAPGPSAGRLLADAAPAAAFELADLTYASMAIVTLVVDHDLELSGSGFLAPPVDGTAVKGSTFSSAKWAWLGESGRAVVRLSLGRAGETTLLHRDDAALAELARADLARALDRPVTPTAWHVQRWGGALPQYTVGHAERIAGLERVIAGVPGLEVCGAAYHGLGVPAVIGTARAAADRLLATLGRLDP